MNRFVTIHGHFYQPPRENPWLEAIELQDSAAPYHDWNERVSAECYEPNTASRILDEEDRIVAIVNNFSRISFNVGPTLLHWMESARPNVYEAILEADRESRARFGGHGSALAQVYNHVIMPLSTQEDKEVQVRWGIRDFERRFGRAPEGMWLSETAVDIPTLEVLAAHGIRFTILAPSQAACIRPLGNPNWEDVRRGRIDPKRAYVQHLPSGRTIALFFYDGPVARAVAFEGLLHRGARFAERLTGLVDGEGPPRLAHIATDGESYGHHHPHGDMALAYALHAIESREMPRLTNYGEFLELNPPEIEVSIEENTSWSCAHGVERWRSDCGCHTGGSPGWNQEWRGPLRKALDWLRDELKAKLADEKELYLASPHEALASYVDVIADRDVRTTRSFLEHHARGPLSAEEEVTVLKLLELERHLQLMYTSCGWFFSDPSGIETIQILRYAGRAIELGEGLFAEPLEGRFLSLLEEAESNRPEKGTGRDIYERSVTPAKFTWESLVANYGITALFEPRPSDERLYCYEIESERFETLRSENTKLAFGRARLTSRLTRASRLLSFAVVHSGDHRVTAGVRQDGDDESFERLARELQELFLVGQMNAVLGALHRGFEGQIHDLSSLFGDARRRVVDLLLDATLRDAEEAYRRLYEQHVSTMRFLAELGVPSPRTLGLVAEVVINGALRRALSALDDEEAIGALLREAATTGIHLDEPTLAFAARGCLESTAERLLDSPADPKRLEDLHRKVRIVSRLPLEVELWKVQNLYFHLLKETAERDLGRAWRKRFRRLGIELAIRPPDPT